MKNRKTLVVIIATILMASSLLIFMRARGREFSSPLQEEPTAEKKIISEIPQALSVERNLASSVISEGRQEMPTSVPLEKAPDREAKKDLPLATIMAKNLEIPWALEFLPDGSIVFTERPGRIRLIDAREGLLPQPLLSIADVAHFGESGLLGIVVHPDFARNGFLYVYYSFWKGGNLANRVVRFKKEGESLVDRKIIIDDIPGAENHNGGRIKFGPDGLLYITTGDALIPNLSQDRRSLAGKILRLKDDGTIPTDNPFPRLSIYSLGHRNPQGLAWDSQGRLWATEHGSRATDELNLIQAGKNYGWPVIRGDDEAPGMESPIIHSGQDTWAPSGAFFSGDSLFFAGLVSQSLYEAIIENSSVTLRRHLRGEFGRLRDVVLGPEGLLYILTSNWDGRGGPGEDDDRLIRINPGKL